MNLDASLITKLGSSFWSKLYAFYHVASLQSYSRAAEHLSVSQSSVSRAVQALESRLKSLLLVRKRGGSVTLTEHGQKIFEQLQGMMVELACLSLSLEQGALKAESLSLKISNWLLSDYCIDAIVQFKKGLPAIALKVQAAIEPNHTIDTGFDINIGCGFVPNKAMVQKPLLSLRLGYYASQGYLHKHGEPKDLKALSHHSIYHDGQTLPVFQNLRNASLDASPDEGAQPLVIHSSACLVKMAEADCGIIALIKEHPTLQGTALVSILEDISQAFSVQSVYFCCSKAMWDRQEVQILYGFLRLFIKNNAKNRRSYAAIA